MLRVLTTAPATADGELDRDQLLLVMREKKTREHNTECDSKLRENLSYSTSERRNILVQLVNIKILLMSNEDCDILKA
jgi:hypothetical protein